MNDHTNDHDLDQNQDAFKRPDNLNVRRVDAQSNAGVREAKIDSDISSDQPHIRPSYLNYIYDVPEEYKNDGKSIDEDVDHVDGGDIEDKNHLDAEMEDETSRAVVEDTNAEKSVLVQEAELENEEDEVLPAREDIYAEQSEGNVLIEVLDWIKYILLAVIIGLLLSYFVIQRSAVQGTSMSPTLLNEDQLLVEKVSVHFAVPKKGSIITVDASKLNNYENNEMLVKRVIASAGDTLDFREGKVFVNGEELEEKYLGEGVQTSAPEGWEGEMTIPDKHVYVLGDNRAFSADSRTFGAVPVDAIVGHVLVRIYPFSRIGTP